MRGLLLANFIRLIHIIIVLFMIIVPLLQILELSILHFTFGISILVHWYCSNNICSLTLLEAKLRGIEIGKGFIYQIIAPVYDFLKWEMISENNLRSGIYVILITLMLISLYTIINGVKSGELYKYYRVLYRSNL
jgi:hypothetical protein